MAEPLPYQHELVDHFLGRIIAGERCLADASGTGVGKTFVALFVAKGLGLTPLIICPKSVIPAWRDACEVIGVEPTAILNYEQIKTGKHPWFSWTHGKRRGEWIVPLNTLLIFDEVHRCRSRASQNAKLLIAARNLQKADVGHIGPEVMLLSATLAESPLHMYAIGYALGLFETGHFWSWAQAHGVRRGRFGWEYVGGAEGMNAVHEKIFPEKGLRKRPEDIPGFPDNQVEALNIPVASPKAVEKAWETLQEKKLLDEPLPIVDQLRARQEIELLKVPTLIELAKDAVDAGNNVVVFLNFLASIEIFLAGVTNSRGLTGDTSESERAEILGEFQQNCISTVVCQARVGGEGVSLHDVAGRPRVSFINPSYSATELIQCLGRIHRAGSQSPAVQRICFADGSDTETRIRRQVERKLKNLEALNDGDLV